MEKDARIAELENVLRKLEKWFDTDQEVLESMSMAEIADHARGTCSVLLNG